MLSEPILLAATNVKTTYCWKWLFGGLFCYHLAYVNFFSKTCVPKIIENWLTLDQVTQNWKSTAVRSENASARARTHVVHTDRQPQYIMHLDSSIGWKGKGKGSSYSITERRVPALISVLGTGSQPAGDVSHKPGGRLPLLSARPAVTLATLKRAATNFAAWWTEAQWAWTVRLRLLPDSVAAAI